MGFSKLLVKRKVSLKDNARLELANKEGRSYFIPTIEKETLEINSFRRWEQAFRVFSGIYTIAHPDRVNQLYQYAETISSASETYIWENVYTYNQTLRQLITAYPYCSWAVLYNHGWNLLLRDKNPRKSNGNNNNGKEKNGKGKNKVCLKFNRSRCTYGTSYKFEHKCSYCGRYGHLMSGYKKKEQQGKDNDKND